MQQLHTIDLASMAKKHWPFPGELRQDEEALHITSETRLYRFHHIDESGEKHPNVVHIVTDGGGGAKVVVHPQSVSEQIFNEHVGDFVESTMKL
jgi:hypothetical protein